ncbi:RNA polymerase sigma factor [Arenibacter sp. ARW7G5Y1]|uniref:RNA polymerase sigma factor n=1 Tax=Arenibacter sp. ARW7G5Y1 TaxID=2135619 RepID=UPI000D7702A7|nr:RNA polymerase sigma-70 factor [Arenibacter sp. ARW7G5Y1]PXX23765.1 RNA polymerase sigma-70 factor (ECF subfamily) [Arenibacter sp. ARW7G5Y1]PXX23772.1 RNA polymerase sigma-70 factor (ECF subfamily) [Arenibacter sp. ARW7G5Y1]
MENIYSDQKKLIKHLKKGNTAAYSYLVDHYYIKLCDYAKNLARDDYRSEDIVQNVIVRMWQQREKLNQNISIKGYLFKSVYNEFIDQYRKDIAITALEKKYIEGLDSVLEEEDFDKSERLVAMVMKTIEHLPPKCKETFLLNKKEGLTYIEIAEFQNVSVNTVEKQIGKAIRIVRETLKDKISTILFLLLKLSPKKNHL